MAMTEPGRHHVKHGAIARKRERSAISSAALPAKEKPTAELTGEELAVIERLVDAGRLIAVPSTGTGKPRRVAAAALHDGGELLLYLSRATTSIE